MPATAVDHHVPANHVQARFTGRDGINKGQPDQAKEEDESRKTSSMSSKNGGGAAVANRFLRKSWTPVRKSVAESVPPQHPSSGLGKDQSPRRTDECAIGRDGRSRRAWRSEHRELTASSSREDSLIVRRSAPPNARSIDLL
jgi:hypothetical protein